MEISLSCDKQIILNVVRKLLEVTDDFTYVEISRYTKPAMTKGDIQDMSHRITKVFGSEPEKVFAGATRWLSWHRDHIRFTLFTESL